MGGGKAIRGALTASLIAGCSVLLLGCSSSSTSKPTVRTSVIEPGGTVPFNLADNARADVKTQPCTQVNGAWVLNGTVRNTAAKSRSFQIVVDFLTEPGSTILGTTVVNVPSVHPGTTANWSATGARGKSPVGCVVRLAQAT